MTAPTIATETCYAERAWTGVEGNFAAGFSAQDPTNITVQYRDANGVVTNLAPGGVNVTVAVDPATWGVTVTPNAMPVAPGTVMIRRNTPAVQNTQFNNLATFSPDVHTQLHDAAAMRSAERKFDIARALLVPPQETGFQLPTIAARKGFFFTWDPVTGAPALTAVTPGLGNVIGPVGVVDGQLALFNVDGAHLKAGGLPGAIAGQTAVASPVAVGAADAYWRINVAAACAVNLPLASSRNGLPLRVKDVSGNASVNNITLNRAGADTLDGAASVQILADYGSVLLVPNKSDNTATGWDVL